MMRLDELGSRAGKAMRDATRGLQPPAITEVRSSRRRRNGTAAALATFVGTLAVIGAVVLWPEGGDTEPVSPPQPTTTTETEGPVETSIREYRLLDGRIATVETDPALTLQSYSFFLDTPDIGGERHVTVAHGDPSDVAATETAEEEATLNGTTTLWRADREGQPLFLSVDLDPWVVWLNVGNENSRPSTDALLQLAQRLTGATDERGVVLEGLELPYYELHLSGSQGELVTLRIGTCFNESVPSSETVADTRWGQVIRSEQRAAWCIGDGELEVVVHGSRAFVDTVVADIAIRINEADLVARWIDGALAGAFDEIARLTFGEFGEPAAMEGLAEQIHDHAQTAPSEPQVTVTDRGTDGTLTYTCFRIDYGDRVDVGMILTRTWPDLGERVWEYRSTGPCDLDDAAIERVVPTWINNTGLTSSIETWHERLPQVCSQAGLDTYIFDDLLVDLATGYITEDTAAGLSQGGPADPVQAADALWLMAVDVCPGLFPPGATEEGPPSSR